VLVFSVYLVFELAFVLLVYFVRVVWFEFEPKNKGNGVYVLERGFSIEGTYYIYAHVTAEKMHNMPKKEFVIGQPSEPEGEGASTEMENGE